MNPGGQNLGFCLREKNLPMLGFRRLWARWTDLVFSKYPIKIQGEPLEGFQNRLERRGPTANPVSFY